MLKKKINLVNKNIASSVKIQPYSFDYLSSNSNKNNFLVKSCLNKLDIQHLCI